MNLVTRCIPLGTLPYDNIDSTTRMSAKIFERAPFIALLPNVSCDDTLLKRTLLNIPGVQFENNEVKIITSTKDYKQELKKLEKAFNSPTSENLEPFAIDSPFIEKYFQLINKFKSPNSVINLLGPFTLSQNLINIAEEQMLVDKTFRKLFIQSVCVKALWAINKIKAINSNITPVIMLEEPQLAQLGNLKRENEDVTIELVTSLFTRVVDKLKSAGAIVGIQCLEKCDWKIPISSGVDIISYDAYNNPNNLCIIPEQIEEFLRRGGKINWGIVPVKNETLIKKLNIDELSKRLFTTMQGLINAGVPEHYVYNSALVSIQGNVDKLPIIFAEKAIILASQLAQKIPLKTQTANH
ncbi:hypothetical protein J6R97_00390 [bacterium]|nr:hypothetical protein [bacterium]